MAGPIRAVLLDIEGTTTPITFVTEKLFPYIRREVKTYLTQHWEEEQVQSDVDALRQQAQEDQSLPTPYPLIPASDAPRDQVIDATVANVQSQMDDDRKITALKQLQGHMWVAGYQSGELQGEVYDDVIEALNKWNEMKIPVYIYSSGSVAAQKLLFGHSTHGDLLPQLAGHFDTTVGLKVETPSYHAIAKSIGIPEGSILFVTDALKELQAADPAGLTLRLSIRPGNAPVDDDTYVSIRSFSELFDGIQYSG